MIDLSPIQDFIDDLTNAGTLVEIAWQVGLAAVSLLLGYWTARVVCREADFSHRRWKFGEGNFEHVASPLAALGYTAIATLILGKYQSTALLDIQRSLLVALLVIRVAVYVLRHIFPHGTALRRAIRVIAWVAWVSVALHVTGLLPDVIDALDSVGITVGKGQQDITLWLVLQAVVALAVTITVALWISRVTETRVLAAQSIEMSTRIVVTKIVRVTALFIAVLVALPLVGIDVTTLSIFSGALGVGLGFGLQKIASNYVSGFIVLLDRSLRIGDVITVDGRKGEVKEIATRYTVIKGLDGVENIIPNETLITQSVSHHTYSDPKVAVVIGLAVAYESDLELACELLTRAAAEHQRVIAEPAASARVKNLADSGVELELTVWIADPSVGEAQLRSDLLKSIVRLYRQNGISIPYPRRDVTLLGTREATPEIPKKPSPSGT
ncbi:MAG TPA: mechanosensitive ion channel domain-containing protein [Usitatibacter sp.]|nr:mechanosensitive ion channel domain-containing protein [Usitatibacter sp.]